MSVFQSLLLSNESISCNRKTNDPFVLLTFFKKFELNSTYSKHMWTLSGNKTRTQLQNVNVGSPIKKNKATLKSCCSRHQLFCFLFILVIDGFSRFVAYTVVQVTCNLLSCFLCLLSEIKLQVQNQNVIQTIYYQTMFL